MTWGQFHKAAKHKILLSLKNLGLAEMGYQPKYHAMYIGSDWFSAKFCLASKFAKQKFLLNSIMKLAADPMYAQWGSIFSPVYLLGSSLYIIPCNIADVLQGTPGTQRRLDRLGCGSGDHLSVDPGIGILTV